MTNEDFWRKGILSIVFSTVGYFMLLVYTNWKICLAVLLINMGNVIDERMRYERIKKEKNE